MSVVIGFTTADYLMLDCDFIDLERLYGWCKKRTEKYHLGSVLINRTSVSKQLTIDNKILPDNHSAIFGKPLPWQETMFHIYEASEDELVDPKFVKMRFQGFITERVNSKNYSIGHPKPVRYIPNGNSEGVLEYLKWYKWFREV